MQHFEQAAPDRKELLPLEHCAAPAFQAQSWVKTTGKCCDDMAVCLTVQQSPQGPLQTELLPQLQSGPNRRIASEAQQLAVAISDAASSGPQKTLTCCHVGGHARRGLGRACSIAHGGGLSGARGLRGSPAPGLHTPCPALGRGPSAAARGRNGLGSCSSCLGALGVRELLIAASCCGSHLQEQASSWVSHRTLQYCLAKGNSLADELQHVQVVQQPPAGPRCTL